MRKRIALLLTALMLALTMAFGAAGAAFADPNCEKVTNNPNCVLVGPGESEESQGKAQDKNPNIKREFKPGGRS